MLARLPLPRFLKIRESSFETIFIRFRVPVNCNLVSYRQKTMDKRQWTKDNGQKIPMMGVVLVWREGRTYPRMESLLDLFIENIVNLIHSC
jgi:hypothetical protein